MVSIGPLSLDRAMGRFVMARRIPLWAENLEGTRLWMLHEPTAHGIGGDAMEGGRADA